jgi:hypothetical protein
MHVFQKNVYSCLFLANSPDVCSSKEYEKLYNEVIRNGMVFSTYPPGSSVSFRHVPITQLSHFYHFLAMVTQKLRMKGILSSALCYTSLLVKSLEMMWES